MELEGLFLLESWVSGTFFWNNKVIAWNTPHDEDRRSILSWGRAWCHLSIKLVLIYASTDPSVRSSPDVPLRRSGLRISWLTYHCSGATVYFMEETGCVYFMDKLQWFVLERENSGSTISGTTCEIFLLLACYWVTFTCVSQRHPNLEVNVDTLFPLGDFWDVIINKCERHWKDKDNTTYQYLFCSFTQVIKYQLTLFLMWS